MNEKLKEKYQRFLEWQQQPHQVKPLSEEEHDCNTCHTHYKGNYCPRCGQASSISRYSFKKAFLLFLDVWGLGNRGMYHTIRDLFLRPGYMVRDYLSGMQSAYFPPFKMLFLLTALSFLVNTGANIEGRNNIKQQIEEFRQEQKDDFQSGMEVGNEQKTAVATQNAKAKPAVKAEDADDVDDFKDEELVAFFDIVVNVLSDIYEWFKTHAAFGLLVWILFLSTSLYFRFRHCPTIPDMHFSEFFVAMTYALNAATIIMIFINFFCLEGNNTDDLCTAIFTIITLKQLSGYGWWRTIWKYILALLILGAVIILTVVVAILFAVLCLGVGDGMA